LRHYTYITVRPLPPFFTHRHRIVYSRIELVNDIAEIQHPAVRAVLAEARVPEGLEIHYDGDLPARSGLGSSSAFTVGLLNAVKTLYGTSLCKKALAAEAIRIEQQVIGEMVGSQDQTWAAHGGFNRFDFRTDGSISVKPVALAENRERALLGSLMLYYTGISREAEVIARSQVANFGARQAELERIGGLVDEAEALLASDRPIDGIGALLHEGWQIKRGLADGVTTDLVDDIYHRARQAGATGGKLLGAGGGGFILLFAPAERHAAVRQALAGLTEVPVDIDPDGSRVVYTSPALDPASTRLAAPAGD
jgi:D-glycero-alpha-D-manno-heptose-7-phosphate kinase